MRMDKNSNESWLDLVSKIGTKTTITSKSVTVKNKSDEPLISIPPDKLFELYGNLVMAGFSEDEALIIIVGVSRNDSN
jgi:hypothetical protein